MEKVSIGLVGAGPMGASLAGACAGLEQACITAVSDVDEAKAKELADKYEARIFTDYHDLLAEQSIQGVIIASPQFLHCEMTVAAAQAGKHVFCEKPMATNVEDCDAMIEACKKNNVHLMIGQVCRFHPVHSKVRELAHSGEYGDPICMVVYRIGGPWGDGSWARPWRLSMERSGGLLMEINAHEIDFLRFVCGEAASVYASGGIYRQTEADYPDIVLTNVKFKSGAVGLLHSSQASAVGGYGGRVDCREGSLHFPVFWGEGAGITCGKFDGESTFIAASKIEVETPVVHEVREFVESVLKNETPPVTGEDGRAAIEIAQAAYQSIETGQGVALPLPRKG